MSEAFLSRWRERIDAALDGLLPPESRWPRTLHRAMRYSVMAGGKRLRPVLALAAARACGGDLEAILPAACGLEMIHTYSLIHDDLPALDDDDWRRGVPTCHREFGEATAILAGDALLTHGLGCFAVHPAGAAWDAARARTTAVVAAAIGTEGMIGGQMEDLEAERENPPGERTPARLERIHAHKTGALIRASLAVGGILSFAPENALELLDGYGAALGLAFQIKDDLLDVESTREETGKETGKDLAHGKMTFPGLLGIEESKRRLAESVARACDAARMLEAGEGPLGDLASFVANRRS
ncbi:MAG TPA: farnesyl diphosphate synthase [Thermoanaerobaculia bacterium]|nr:farnesyl diphosphate synthase [Thermoanaerobaculia bacterium]